MKKNLCRRTVAYTSGILILTLGVGLTVKANLGVSPTTSVPYTLTLMTGIDMGKTTILFHSFLIVLQVVLLKKSFKIKNLLQIPVAIIFGYFTDLSNKAIDMIPFGSTLPVRLILNILGTFLIALGVSIYLPADLIPVAVEGTIQILSEKIKTEFSTIKISFDISLVIISAIICICFLGSLGSIGIGTVISAFLTGAFMKLIKFLSGKFNLKLQRRRTDVKNRSWI